MRIVILKPTARALLTQWTANSSAFGDILTQTDTPMCLPSTPHVSKEWLRELTKGGKVFPSARHQEIVRSIRALSPSYSCSFQLVRSLIAVSQSYTFLIKRSFFDPQSVWMTIHIWIIPSITIVLTSYFLSRAAMSKKDKDKDKDKEKEKKGLFGKHSKDDKRGSSNPNILPAPSTQSSSRLDFSPGPLPLRLFHWKLHYITFRR